MISRLNLKRISAAGCVKLFLSIVQRPLLAGVVAVMITVDRKPAHLIAISRSRYRVGHKIIVFAVQISRRRSRRRRRCRPL